MLIKIEFPFIDRKQTANQKADGSHFLSRELKRELKAKANTFVYLAKLQYKIEKPFYGAVLHRFWFFKDKRKRDYDNFFSGTKYYTDALVKQKIIESDDSEHLLVGQSYFYDNRKEEKLVYVLESLNEESFGVIEFFVKLV
jgi:hypothetical protein